jgi:hypothetical protein
METTDRVNAAYATFMTALRQAPSDPDFAQRALDAYNGYTAALTEASKEPAVADVSREFEKYRAVITSGLGGPDSVNQIRSAYRTYVAEIRAAWAEIDPGMLSPADLATIGQSLTYLAWLVETSLGGAETPTTQRGGDAVGDEHGTSLWGSTSVLTDSSRVTG